MLGERKEGEEGLEARWWARQSIFGGLCGWCWGFLWWLTLTTNHRAKDGMACGQQSSVLFWQGSQGNEDSWRGFSNGNFHRKMKHTNKQGDLGQPNQSKKSRMRDAMRRKMRIYFREEDISFLESASVWFPRLMVSEMLQKKKKKKKMMSSGGSQRKKKGCKAKLITRQLAREGHQFEWLGAEHAFPSPPAFGKSPESSSPLDAHHQAWM